MSWGEAETLDHRDWLTGTPPSSRDTLCPDNTLLN